MRSPGHYNDGSLRSPRMNGEDDEEELPAYRRSPGPLSGNRTPARTSATDVRCGNSSAPPPQANNRQGTVPSPGGIIPGGPFNASFGVPPPPPPPFLGTPFPPGFPPPGMPVPWFGTGPMPNQFGMCNVPQPPWMGAMPGIPIFGVAPPPNFSAQPPPGQPIFGNPQPPPPPPPAQEPMQSTQANASTPNTGPSVSKTQPVVPPKPRERVGGSKFLDTAPPPPLHASEETSLIALFVAFARGERRYDIGLTGTYLCF
ncbi:unnamed protein product [Heligmosomoides polygyrus]|uniref:Uncharacterized protein n=1 Tax=Heligmosomoides polygyrus TaxID=6339 RepID=A0A183FFL7_HELPZ|nr:unnamed protein product [Heligmosomoides polygyrus]